jgi:hypothetical protein
MEVDTGQFAALTDEVARLRQEVSDLARSVSVSRVVEEILAGTAPVLDVRAVRGKPPRPRHLRAVDGGAS